MLPLFDMMMKAQGGNAMEAMAKQFGLAQDQMQQAMAALMPAFSTGLKRSVTNPYDFSSLMSAAASGNYGQYFEDLTKAFSPQGVAERLTLVASSAFEIRPSRERICRMRMSRLSRANVMRGRSIARTALSNDPFCFYFVS